MPINTPDDEPYLGLESLMMYNKMLVICFEKLKNLPRLSTNNSKELESLTDHQRMAVQVINQSVNLGASIRELIRQGYLFGALVLERSFVERIMILLYLNKYPDQIKVWNAGWSKQRSLDKALRAPDLAKMLEEVGKDFDGEIPKTHAYNDLIHGKPSSLAHGLIVGDNEFIVSPSKTNNNIQDCDKLCHTVAPFLVVLLSMMTAYFPE
ncbi:TPA: hypothetical protein I7673_02470 [Vibrio vulnificus]|nr:hypothetical protein [Vibrio vulnificus]